MPNLSDLFVSSTLAGLTDTNISSPADGEVLTYNSTSGKWENQNLPLDKSILATLEQNILLNAFRIAINGSLTQFGMVDGVMDEFEDESGVDTANSTNADYDSTNDLYKPISTGTPIAHYPLNDNAATTVVDDIQNNYEGTCSVNTNTLSTTGKINSGFSMDGTGTTVDLGAIPMPANGAISLWFKPDVNIGVSNVPSDYRYFFRRGSDYEPVARIQRAETSNPGQTIFSASGTELSYSKDYVAGTWYHMVFTWGSRGQEIWINGEKVASDSNTGAASGSVSWLLGYNSEGGALDGVFDDVRIYNTQIDEATILAIYNDGIGTELDGILNMTLISQAFTAESQPDEARIVIFEEDVDSITLNTDLKAYVSRDGGTTWTQVTLADEGNYSGSKRILTGSVDISGQPAGTSMKWKLVTNNNKDLKIHGVGLTWR